MSIVCVEKRVTCKKPVIESGRKFDKPRICVALPPDTASVKLLIDANVPLNPILFSIAWNTGRIDPQTSSQTNKTLIACTYEGHTFEGLNW